MFAKIIKVDVIIPENGVLLTACYASSTTLDDLGQVCATALSID